MSFNDAICCIECGAETIRARPVCNLCESEKGMYAPPAPAPAKPKTLDAKDVENLRLALAWMGVSAPESHEECSIHQVALVRELIDATLDARKRMLEQSTAPDLKDHEIREAVGKLCDVAVQFHGAGQLRARIQDVVLPLVRRR